MAELTRSEFEKMFDEQANAAPASEPSFMDRTLGALDTISDYVPILNTMKAGYNAPRDFYELANTREGQGKVRTFAQGVPFVGTGFDEAEAYLATLGGSDQDYENELQYIRDTTREYQEANPVESIFTQLAASVPVALGSAAKTGATKLGSALLPFEKALTANNAARYGTLALEGGLSGFGQEEGSFDERADQAFRSAVLTTALGGIGDTARFGKKMMKNAIGTAERDAILGSVGLSKPALNVVEEELADRIALNGSRLNPESIARRAIAKKIVKPGQEIAERANAIKAKASKIYEDFVAPEVKKIDGSNLKIRVGTKSFPETMKVLSEKAQIEYSPKTPLEAIVFRSTGKNKQFTTSQARLLNEKKEELGALINRLNNSGKLQSLLQEKSSVQDLVSSLESTGFTKDFSRALARDLKRNANSVVKKASNKLPGISPTRFDRGMKAYEELEVLKNSYAAQGVRSQGAPSSEKISRVIDAFGSEELAGSVANKLGAAQTAIGVAEQIPLPRTAQVGVVLSDDPGPEGIQEGGGISRDEFLRLFDEETAASNPQLGSRISPDPEGFFLDKKEETPVQPGRKAVEVIKKFEKQELEKYLDPGRVETIGYGHTGEGVEEGKITPQRAEELLQKDLSQKAEAVSRLVEVPLSQNQFDALVSFTFNVGEGNLANSTLLKKLNAGDYEGAANEMERWVYDKEASDKPLRGLVKRRKEEKELFLS